MADRIINGVYFRRRTAPPAQPQPPAPLPPGLQIFGEYSRGHGIIGEFVAPVAIPTEPPPPPQPQWKPPKPDWEREAIEQAARDRQQLELERQAREREEEGRK